MLISCVEAAQLICTFRFAYAKKNRFSHDKAHFLSGFQLDITVTDLNEGTPRFPVSAYNKDDVPENTLPGTSLLTGKNS